MAALVNAANADVDYLYSEQDVSDMVQQPYVSEDFKDFKEDFEAQNEYCPPD